MRLRVQIGVRRRSQIELAHRYDKDSLSFGTKLDSKGRRHITQSEWSPLTKGACHADRRLRHHARDLRQRVRTIPRVPHGVRLSLAAAPSALRHQRHIGPAVVRSCRSVALALLGGMTADEASGSRTRARERAARSDRRRSGAEHRRAGGGREGTLVSPSRRRQTTTVDDRRRPRKTAMAARRLVCRVACPATAFILRPHRRVHRAASTPPPRRPGGLLVPSHVLLILACVEAHAL